MLSVNSLNEIQQMILVIIGVLVFASTLFWIMRKIKPGPQVDELVLRTKSWWIMAGIFITAALVHPGISFVAFGFLSFAALRELSSISKNARIEDRSVIFWAYLAIPVQYYIAYMGWFAPFLIFIPVFMFTWIPFLLVLKGHTQDIARSMSVIPTHLMLTVFSISHLAYLLSLPELPGFEVGGRGLLLYVVFLTEMNDVFQFTWGKLLGRRKIIEKISPNKTWEGFIGGLLSTVAAAYFLRFLTPFSAEIALLAGLLIACSGFVGDIIVSAIKRDFGLKDTGNAIKGHGGILDRIDSLAISSPFFFYFVYLLYYVR
ncbi:MAG: phosphatidate cytidylyltransferase [Flavobacteriia bacterium]|jgi:phosphatidate cytidylyltransferase|nr:phosphatidate cytidylyltransferase [Cryomorphaceae bacterium]NDE04969.1 phosphatidate cytidylyltransferase [Flavobacteriia bacterium]